MEEKRKERRMKINLLLEISSLFKQNNIRVEHLDAPINVIDISKSGIGFTSICKLPLNYYFNACLTIGKEDAKLYCVIKIIRSQKQADGLILYGCEFVGMSPVLSYIFDDYEMML